MYQVIVLVEQPVTEWDARQITALRRDATDTTRYVVLLPVEDAARQVEATIGSLAASDVMGTAALYLDESDLERVRQEIREESQAALDASIAAFTHQGADAIGEVTALDPLERLQSIVKERDASEVIIVTRPHVIAELLHLDWTSRARKHLDVPCLHLIAQSEPDWETEAEEIEQGVREADGDLPEVEDLDDAAESDPGSSDEPTGGERS